MNWTDKLGNILSTDPTYSFSITDNTELCANFTDICDVDRNGEINVLDIAEVARNYNVRSTQTNWNPAIDFNSDGIIDIFDLVVCSKKIN
jgi:hypothetical protein